METADFVICGSGIVGLTLARELVARGADSILIIEKEEKPGLHASGRNSGVLHAGIYYSPDSKRAHTCLAGNRLMKSYCREHGLPLLENGKVIVTSAPEQLPTLDELFRRAQAGGANVVMVDEKELAEIEPNARTVTRALHSRDTAVISPKAVLQSLREELTLSGRVRFSFGRRVLGRKPGASRTLLTCQGPVRYGFFINASGAHADKVAAYFDVGRKYRLLPFKGLYRQLKPERTELVRGSIYPVPDIRNPFLGVHFTRSVSGEVHIGPTAIPVGY